MATPGTLPAIACLAFAAAAGRRGGVRRGPGRFLSPYRLSSVDCSKKSPASVAFGGAPANLCRRPGSTGRKDSAVYPGRGDAFGRFGAGFSWSGGHRHRWPVSARERPHRHHLRIANRSGDGRRGTLVSVLSPSPADMLIAPGQIDERAPICAFAVACFTFGSSTLSREPSRAATLRALELATGGSQRSPPGLMRCQPAAAPVAEIKDAPPLLRRLLADCDIVKLQPEEPRPLGTEDGKGAAASPRRRYRRRRDPRRERLLSTAQPAATSPRRVGARCRSHRRRRRFSAGSRPLAGRSGRPRPFTSWAFPATICENDSAGPNAAQIGRRQPCPPSGRPGFAPAVGDHWPASRRRTSRGHRNSAARKRARCDPGRTAAAAHPIVPILRMASPRSAACLPPSRCHRVASSNSTRAIALLHALVALCRRSARKSSASSRRTRCR